MKIEAYFEDAIVEGSQTEIDRLGLQFDSALTEYTSLIDRMNDNSNRPSDAEIEASHKRLEIINDRYAAIYKSNLS